MKTDSAAAAAAAAAAGAPTDSENAEGIMKGVIAKQSNYKRPFSPANFSQLTTSKLGRPAGTAPIGMNMLRRLLLRVAVRGGGGG